MTAIRRFLEEEYPEMLGLRIEVWQEEPRNPPEYGRHLRKAWAFSICDPNVEPSEGDDGRRHGYVDVDGTVDGLY